MRQILITTSVAGLLCCSPSALLLAAQASPGTVQDPPVADASAPAPKPAPACLDDIRAFNTQLDKDGYWLGGADYGYGYPMGGYGYGYGYGSVMGGIPAATGDGYQNARPGYEVRTLIVSANILAQNGQNQSCEDVMSTAHQIYKNYIDDMHGRGVSRVDGRGWQLQQIATAQPVSSQTTPVRSDQLLDTDVLNPQNESLGQVHDLIMKPQSGKIAYLVIGRGGFLGIDEKYIPVPWNDFKSTQSGNFLVLDTTKASMDAAPKVQKDRFSQPDQYDQQSQIVNQYWQSHLSNKVSN